MKIEVVVCVLRHEYSDQIMQSSVKPIYTKKLQSGTNEKCEHGTNIPVKVLTPPGYLEVERAELRQIKEILLYRVYLTWS